MRDCTAAHFGTRGRGHTASFLPHHFRQRSDTPRDRWPPLCGTCTSTCHGAVEWLPCWTETSCCIHHSSCWLRTMLRFADPEISDGVRLRADCEEGNDKIRCCDLAVAAEADGYYHRLTRMRE